MENEQEIMKKCKKCQIQLNILDYHKNKNYKDKREYYCKECKRIPRKIRYWKDRERNLATNRKWNREHPESIYAARQRYNEKHPDEIKRTRNNRRTKIKETKTNKIDYDILYVES